MTKNRHHKNVFVMLSPVRANKDFIKFIFPETNFDKLKSFLN